MTQVEVGGAVVEVPERDPYLWVLDVVEEAERDPELDALDVVEVRSLALLAAAQSLL